ncbi:MAG: hypothetical protein WA948_02030 [Pontixanthobacter sp.]
MIVGTLAVTGGCVEMAMRDVRAEAVAQCEMEGKTFFERDAINKGGMFGTVSVTGQCLGPDDEGYAEAVENARERTLGTPE